MVDAALIASVVAGENIVDFVVYVPDSFEDAFAEIVLFVAIAKLECFASAGRCARWYGGTASIATFENYVSLDGWIAARVEDLAGFDEFNVAVFWLHKLMPFLYSLSFYAIFLGLFYHAYAKISLF